MTRPGNYWHMLPQATQARKALWEAINPHTGIRRIDEAFPPEIRDTTREQEMLIRFKSGATWQVVGSDNYDSLVGSPPVGVVFSEWALAKPQAWAYLRPILAENGGWALFITTPRGKNHAQRMLGFAQSDPTWFGQVLPATETNVFTPEQLKSELKEYIAQFDDEALGRAMYEQEYLCSFEPAIIGAYYAEQLRKAREDGRITRVPYDTAAPVHVAWDLGIGDSCALWFAQVVGKEIHLIDYHEKSGKGLDYYARYLASKPYLYADDLLPHDAEARELGTGKTRVETLRQLGRKARVIPRQSVDDGINAVRMLLSRCWFDEEKCSDGLSALLNYRAEYSEKHKTLAAHPVHDWASHGADSFRYLAMGLRETIKVREPQKAKPRRVTSEHGWLAA